MSSSVERSYFGFEREVFREEGYRKASVHLS